jgi:hypothetical protein
MRIIAQRLAPSVVAIISVVAIAGSGPNADAAGMPPSPAGPERRGAPDDLSKIADGYRLGPGSDARRIATRHEAPAIRWNSRVSEIDDAVLFVWMFEGRPIAAATFLQQRNIGIYHEFQSLTTGPVQAEREGRVIWDSKSPGIAFAPVSGAPAPADTPARRMIQMREMSQDFRAEAIKGPPFYPRDSVAVFRLLPTPLLRYGGGDRDHDRPEEARDGAIFAFVQGTDPEVLLILEARAHAGGSRWEYAFARMNGWVLKGWHREKEVWSVPRQHPGHDPIQPYFVAGPFPIAGDRKDR